MGNPFLRQCQINSSSRHIALFSLWSFVIGCKTPKHMCVFPLVAASVETQWGRAGALALSSRPVKYPGTEVVMTKPSLVSVPLVLGWCVGCPEAVQTGVSTSSPQLTMAFCWEPWQRKHVEICAVKWECFLQHHTYKSMPWSWWQQAKITCFWQFHTVEECFTVSKNNFIYWCLCSFTDKNKSNNFLWRKSWRHGCHRFLLSSLPDPSGPAGCIRNLTSPVSWMPKQTKAFPQEQPWTTSDSAHADRPYRQKPSPFRIPRFGKLKSSNLIWIPAYS